MAVLETKHVFLDFKFVVCHFGLQNIIQSKTVKS